MSRSRAHGVFPRASYNPHIRTAIASRPLGTAFDASGCFPLNSEKHFDLLLSTKYNYINRLQRRSHVEVASGHIINIHCECIHYIVTITDECVALHNGQVDGPAVIKYYVMPSLTLPKKFLRTSCNMQFHDVQRTCTLYGPPRPQHAISTTYPRFSTLTIQRTERQMHPSTYEYLQPTAEQ